jgi:dTDP-4-dehydrorhamnose 3,5-epimerase
MIFEATPLAGVWRVGATPAEDERGSFTRLHCTEAFDKVVPGLRFVQTNLSASRERGTVRGLHLQRAPAQEWKLVRCLRDAVFDVAADLRRDSATFGRHVAIELTEADSVGLLIPPGVAHGFQTLEDHVRMLYQHSSAHDPALDDGIRHDDPLLAIAWPLPVSRISARDGGLPGLEERCR